MTSSGRSEFTFFREDAGTWFGTNYLNDTIWRDGPAQDAWLENLLLIIEAFKATNRVPVVVNEFGVMRWEPGAAQFVQDQIDWFERHSINHALWLSDASWEQHSSNDDFDFRYGPDPDNHLEVTSSDLATVMVNSWRRNMVRPSSFFSIF